MKLKTLRLAGNWSLQRPIPLRNQNLLVGLNASGKTTVISRIELLAKLISGELKPADILSTLTFAFVAEFDDDTTPLTYELTITNSQVVHEKFHSRSQDLMTRNDRGAGTIYYQEAKKPMDFQTPTTALAVVSREDSTQHPYFAPLTNWAKNLYCVYFGSNLAKRDIKTVGPTKSSTSLDDGSLRPSSDILLLLQRGLLSAHRVAFQKSIIDDMATLNYFIEDIDFRIAPEFINRIPGTGTILATFGSEPDFRRSITPMVAFIRERGIHEPIDQLRLSEGMLRALYVIIYLNFMQFSSHPSCILIDDIGEGLDYDRSCALIKLVQQRAEAGRVQLIMSTNDRFVMNSVPLENWTVLRRAGSEVNVYDYESSRTIFDDFKDTGLNNFDFLRMDFLGPEHQGDQSK